MDWFEKLTGFREVGYSHAQSRLQVEAERLTSTVNGRSYGIGRLELPSLGELRERTAGRRGAGRLTVSNLVGDVRALHHDGANRGAFFQVASQFNLLEMIGPEVTPEDGVTRYAGDPTQGPACAIAAGAATIWRNYFVPVGGHAGQTAARQIDAAADLRAALAEAIGVTAEELWRMRNGYALPTASSLALVDDYLSAIDDQARETLKATLRIGVHRDVEVTDGPTPGHAVTQAYCSAMPVSYSGLDPAAWEPLARLALEAAYEATLAAALLRYGETASAPVFLTCLGGGAFGNDGAWIDDAIRLALERYRDATLDVRFVSYGAVPASLREIEAAFNGSARR